MLSQGMLCFAKMLLAPRRSLLRITLGGAAAPPNHPGVFDFPVFTVARSFMRTNIPVNKEDIADWFLQYPLFYTILSIKDYQIWDGFFALAKLNGGRRSSATLTGMKQRQDGKDTQR